MAREENKSNAVSMLSSMLSLGETEGTAISAVSGSQALLPSSIMKKRRKVSEFSVKVGNQL